MVVQHFIQPGPTRPHFSLPAAALLFLAIATACSLGGVSTATAKEVVITFGGDVSANRSRIAPQADGTQFGRRVGHWSEWTRAIVPLLNGDLNFINLETVLADKPLRDARKKYTFLSHPNAVRYLVKKGVNLFSLANNHAYDYGDAGVRSTLRHMRAIKREAGGRIWFAGIGLNDGQAAAVTRFKVRGHTFAYAAIGNLTNMNRKHRAGAKKPGSLGIRIVEDYERVLRKLRATKADFRILSCHLGVERRTRLDGGQREKYERALDFAGVDLLIGHHPHVVRAVQRHGKGVIFYSLGNYMMRGARDMTPLPDRHDYGLFGRAYLDVDPATKRLAVRALEVIPLTQMHEFSRPMKGGEAKRRIRVLNQVSRKSVDKEAVRFLERGDGSAVACFKGSKGKRARRICGR